MCSLLGHRAYLAVKFQFLLDPRSMCPVKVLLPDGQALEPPPVLAHCRWTSPGPSHVQRGGHFWVPQEAPDFYLGSITDSSPLVHKDVSLLLLDQGRLIGMKMFSV